MDGDRKRFYGINGMGKYAMTNYVNELKYSYAKLGFKSLSGSGVAKVYGVRLCWIIYSIEIEEKYSKIYFQRELKGEKVMDSL